MRIFFLFRFTLEPDVKTIVVQVLVVGFGWFVLVVHTATQGKQTIDVKRKTFSLKFYLFSVTEIET